MYINFFGKYKKIKLSLELNNKICIIYKIFKIKKYIKVI